LHARDRERARWLDRNCAERVFRDVERACVFPWRHRGERADRKARRETTGQFRGRENCRIRRGVDEITARGSARRRTDAAAVEPTRSADEALPASREQLVAFDEEGTPLL